MSEEDKEKEIVKKIYEEIKDWQDSLKHISEVVIAGAFSMIVLLLSIVKHPTLFLQFGIIILGFSMVFQFQLLINTIEYSKPKDKKESKQTIIRTFKEKIQQDYIINFFQISLMLIFWHFMDLFTFMFILSLIIIPYFILKKLHKDIRERKKLDLKNKMNPNLKKFYLWEVRETIFTIIFSSLIILILLLDFLSSKLAIFGEFFESFLNSSIQ